MSGRTTKRKPEAELTVNERVEINNARQAIVAASGVLAKYGLHETAEPLTELGYEQRMARGRALELAASNGFGKNSDATVDIAQKFYEFIWKGSENAAVDG
jgi:hypothetical protein